MYRDNATSARKIATNRRASKVEIHSAALGDSLASPTECQMVIYCKPAAVTDYLSLFHYPKVILATRI